MNYVTGGGVGSPNLGRVLVGTTGICLTIFGFEMSATGFYRNALASIEPTVPRDLHGVVFPECCPHSGRHDTP
jgi:hypothetical protein